MDYLDVEELKKLNDICFSNIEKLANKFRDGKNKYTVIKFIVPTRADYLIFRDTEKLMEVTAKKDEITFTEAETGVFFQMYINTDEKMIQISEQINGKNLVNCIVDTESQKILNVDAVVTNEDDTRNTTCISDCQFADEQMDYYEQTDFENPLNEEYLETERGLNKQYYGENYQEYEMGEEDCDELDYQEYEMGEEDCDELDYQDYEMGEEESYDSELFYEDYTDDSRVTLSKLINIGGQAFEFITEGSSVDIDDEEYINSVETSMKNLKEFFEQNFIRQYKGINQLLKSILECKVLDKMDGKENNLEK